jgi:sporulation protein YlmC with PRC-barrel domain
MLKQLLSATAMVTIASVSYAATPASPAPAATTSSTVNSGPAFVTAATANEHLASKLIGADVYESTAANAQSIGKVNDILIGDNGAINAVVVGVGGFLGVGQKNVALAYPSLQWTERDGNPILVTAASKDELQNATAFDTAALDQRDQASRDAAKQETAVVTPDNGMAPNTDTAMSNNPAPASQAMSPDTSTSAAMTDTSKISAQDLMNTPVYSAKNKDLGQVGDVVLSKDGKIDAMIIDVGGFLGIGQKPVAIAFDGIDIRKDTSGKLTVHTRFTKQELEAAPKYDKDKYVSERETMRLSNPS